MKDLRKTVKKLLIDKGLDYKGFQIELSNRLSINRRSLSMALTGYRKTPGSVKILNDLKSFLLKEKGNGGQ